MKDYYTKYRELLQDVVSKSENEFEKKVIYIAAGALGLSFSFISDIVEIANACHKWCLSLGWVLLIVCILINLCSHISSKNKANKTIDEIDKFLSEELGDDNQLRKAIDKRNKITNIINYITVSLAIIGIVFIIFFVVYNIYK